jgi:hypothetical protein
MNKRRLYTSPASTSARIRFVVAQEFNHEHIHQSYSRVFTRRLKTTGSLGVFQGLSNDKASGFGSAILTIHLTLVFICLMLFVLKRQANRVINAYLEAETQRRVLIAIILIFGLASALLKCRNPRIPDRAGRDRSADRPEPVRL